MAITIYFDGLCEPVNPGGIATYGYTIYRDSEKIHEEYGIAGVGSRGEWTSNNTAEYTALIKALQWLLENSYTNEEVKAYGDSQLVVKQLTGEYRVRSPHLKPLHQKTLQLIKQFKKFTIHWIPRSQNREADQLSRKAYQQYMENQRLLT